MVSKKLRNALIRASWNSGGIIISSAIGGVLVFFGNKHMVENSSETYNALIIMVIVAVVFLFPYLI